MNKMRRGWIFFAALLASATLSTLGASPALVLNPVSGNIAGPPGSTIGWGFTITNDIGYIEINSAQFCDNPVNPPACNGPTTGVFNDFTGYNDIIVGPPGGTDPDSVTQPFDAINLTGVGSFQVDPAANPGDSDSGEIVLSYTLTSLDPNDPNAVFEGTGFLTALAGVTVTATPEPGAAGLLVLPFAFFAFRQARNRQHKSRP